MIQLRDYQETILDKIAEAEARGVRKQMVVAATGLGKTMVFTALARLRGDKRTLIIAHRDELIDQAMRKVREAWPEQTSVGKVKAGDNQVAAHVVVASIQTLARASRLEKLVNPSAMAFAFAEPTPFGLVVVDEAHHASADSYRRVLEALRVGEPDGPLLLGVTATPDRGDGRGLDDTFDEIVASYDLQWGIQNNYLSDLRGVRVSIDMDMGKVKIRRGDYDAGQTGRIMEAAGAPALIVKAWQEHAADRRTLVFTPTVEMADQVRARFVDQCVAAGWVHGEMEQTERQKALRDYSAGDLQVLVNCAVLTEGYDEPRTDCIVMARPTKSRALFTQCVGRGTRLHPEKDDCLVLDVVGATHDHSLITVPTLFGIRREFERDVEREGATVVFARQAKLDVAEGRLRAEDADLFRKVRADGMAWVQLHTKGAPERRYFLNLGRNVGTLVLRQMAPATDIWRCGYRDANGVKSVLADGVSLTMAQGVGEDAARRLAPDARHLTNAKASWRARPPSTAQIEFARTWRVQIDPRWNAGQLSDQVAARIEIVQNKKRTRKV